MKRPDSDCAQDSRPPGLRVLTWNVLADAYVSKARYPSVAPALLEPERRRELIVSMAIGYDCDVIAFQEAEPALVDLVVRRMDTHDVRWCPKGNNRPDGCMTAVRRTLTIAGEQRVEYSDGAESSGHVAHVLDLVDPRGERLRVINTHLRWAPPGTPIDVHIGVKQMREALTHIEDGSAVVVVVGDLNDLEGGPTRVAMADRGLREVQGAGATAYVEHLGLQALDVIAVTPALRVSGWTGVEAASPLPNAMCPSDHVLVLAEMQHRR